MTPTLDPKFQADHDFALDYAEGDETAAPDILRLILTDMGPARIARAITIAVSIDGGAELRSRLAKMSIQNDLPPSEELTTRLIEDAEGDPALVETATHLFERFAAVNPHRIQRYLRSKDGRLLALMSAKWLLDELRDDKLIEKEQALDVFVESRRFDLLATVGATRPERARWLADELIRRNVELDEHAARLIARAGVSRLWSKTAIISTVTAIVRLCPELLEVCVASGLGESLAEVVGVLDQADAVRVLRTIARNPGTRGKALALGLVALMRTSEETGLAVTLDRLPLRDTWRDRGDDIECDVWRAVELLAPRPSNEPTGRRFPISPFQLQRNDSDDEARFAECPSGAIAVKLTDILGSSVEADNSLQQLVGAWWNQYATEEEWDLVLPIAATHGAECLLTAIQRASRGALTRIAQAGADAQLPELVADRSDAIDLWIAFAQHASDPKTVARSRALAAQRGAGLPPPDDDLSVSIDTLAAMHIRDGVEHTADQLAYAVAVLKAPRDLLLEHPSLGRTLGCLVRLSEQAGLAEGREIWIAAIGRPDADLQTRLLLSAFPWHEDREITTRLATTLGALPASRLDKIFDAHNPISLELALAWARTPKTPVALRARAALAAFQHEKFDPAKCDLSGDPELARLLLGFDTRFGAAREYVLRNAVREIARAARDDSNSTAELRVQVVELCRVESTAKFVRETLTDYVWDRLRAVHSEKGNISIELEKLGAWIEAAGWTRDRRFEDVLKKLSKRLRASESAVLESILDVALAEIQKPSRMSEVGIIKLAFRSLAARR